MATMSNPGMGPDSAANRTSRFRPQTSMAEELARAQTFTGATGAALATLEGDALVWLGAVGENPPKAGDRWSLAGSFVKLCLGRKTRPQRCDNVEGDGRVDAAFRGLHAKSLAIAPVHDEGKVTGILAVFSNNHSAFNGMHTAVLQTEADHLAELVQQARSAVGIRQEEKKAEAPAENPQPVAESTAPPAASTTALASAPPQRTAQQESDALEAAFVVIPPPVAAPPSTPPVEVAPPVLPATPAAAAPGAVSAEASVLPKLMVVPTPPPSPAPTSALERPTLPGFMPLSATAAALAKAKPMPPTSPEMVVEKKAPKPAAASPQPAAEAKKPVTPPAPSAPTPVPTPPPMRAAAVPRTSAVTPVPTPLPAPVAASAREPVAAPKAAAPPSIKFVPLAKPEVKTPPPGSLKPVTKETKETKETADDFLPAATDPFAEAAPVHLRSQARTTSAAIPTRAILAGLEGAERKPATGTWRLPLVVAVVAALALGGLWLKTRSHAPAAAKTAPVVTQPAPAPAPAPAATSEVAAATTVTGSPVAPAPAATNITAETVPPSKPSVTADKPAPEKAVPQVKTQPAAVTAVTSKPPAPAPTVMAPANTEVKTSAPLSVPVVAHQQEPPPKTMLSVPAAAATRMPDLPKPEAPAAGVLRQASTPVAPQLLENVQPVYPAAAKAMHLQGTVRVSAKLSPQGRVTEVTWISGNSFFRDSVVSAVKQWRYKPATLDGQPVDSTVEIVLKFLPQ